MRSLLYCRPELLIYQWVKAFFAGKEIPRKIFTIDYFVDKAKQLEMLGADIISIKDMAGLIPPRDAGEINFSGSKAKYPFL